MGDGKGHFLGYGWSLEYGRRQGYGRVDVMLQTQLLPLLSLHK